MATVSSSLHSLQKQFLGPKYPRIHRNFQVRPHLRYSSTVFSFSSSGIRASSSVTLKSKQITEPNQSVEEDVEIFACPVCYEPLVRIGPPGINLAAIYRSGFKCRKCEKSYSSKEIYLDLTVTAGLRDYTEGKPVGTELFRSPLVSFLYERGWRQNFNRSGFPGPDEEFKMAQDYFKPAEGGFLVDVSCASGLFSRKFAKSGTYSAVVALDFSENMLRQCYDFIKRDGTLLTSNLALVRADVSRLPFPSSSIDAVHAGAALHCWPSPSNAGWWVDTDASCHVCYDRDLFKSYFVSEDKKVLLDDSYSTKIADTGEVAEITRVLRSGGVFVGTTFLRYTKSTPLILRPLRERIIQNYNYLTEEEIEDLCTSSGLTNYSSKVQQSFIMFSAQKP